MVPRSLQEDLLRIPGVEGAEVEGSGDQPAGLRIRIAAGADQRAVGTAIRRVLTEHGLGTDTRLPGESPPADEPAAADLASDLSADTDVPADVETEPSSPVSVLEEADDSVIDLTEEAPEPAAESLDEEAAGSDGSIPIAGAGIEDAADEESTDADAEAVSPAPEAARPVAAVAPLPAPAEADGGFARIESVSVEEGRDGILVTVTASDGETVRQVASSSEGGLDAAIVTAVSRLALPESPDPVIVDLEERRIEGVDIVMLVLDSDGHITAGSSVVVAGRPFAIGRAAWAALNV